MSTRTRDDDAAQDGNTGGMAGGPRRAPRGGEGADPPQRRAGAEAARAAVGGGREGLSVRDRRRDEIAGRPLRRPLATARLPLHVRARLRSRLPGVLLDRGQPRRERGPPEGPRRDLDLLLTRAAGEAATVQG